MLIKSNADGANFAIINTYVRTYPPDELRRIFADRGFAIQEIADSRLGIGSAGPVDRSVVALPARP